MVEVDCWDGVAGAMLVRGILAPLLCESALALRHSLLKVAFAFIDDCS